MVYTVDRDPRYEVFKSERDTTRKDLSNPDLLYSESGAMRLYRYMIRQADRMTELEVEAWHRRD